MFAYHTACGAYRQNYCMTSGRIICPEKQWHRYSLEDLMTKYQWYFAPQKLKRKKRKVCFNFVRETLHYCGGHKWNKQPKIHMKKRKLSCLANDKHGANYAVRASHFFRLTTVSSNNRNLNSNDIASYVINLHLSHCCKNQEEQKDKPFSHCLFLNGCMDLFTLPSRQSTEWATLVNSMSSLTSTNTTSPTQWWA